MFDINKNRRIRKAFTIVALLCAVGIISSMWHIYQSKLDVKAISQTESISENTTEFQEFPNLGQGFNIGNSLDVCDWTYFGSKYNSGFQAALVYSSQPWSAWDASEYPYFDNDDKVTINWKISKFNSKPDTYAGKLAVQLVNHNKEYDGTSVKCTITEAKIKLASGKIINLLENGSKSFDIEIQNEKTGYMSMDLIKYGLKTSAFDGAEICVKLEISDYYKDISNQISNLEKYWGNPPISEEMIKAIKKEGFDTVRIPVTYFNHISDDGVIDKEFLDRVEEVVDWVIDNDMYCIIDVHNDTGNDGWIKASEANYKSNKDMVYSIFEQIAGRFKRKNDHLILEGLNEAVNNQNQWGDIPEEDLEVMNKWNQLFVDAVRSTGENNSERYLIVNTYAALSSKECLDSFRLPQDTIDNRILVGIHCYFDKNGMEKGFDRVKNYSEKYNFVISEWGFVEKTEDRASVVNNFEKHAKKLGIPTIWWDNGRKNEFAILNRDTLDWYLHILERD